MRTLIAAVLVASTPVAAHPPGTTAGAQEFYVHQHFSHGATGATCGFASTEDVTREPGWQTGTLYGGPLVSLEAGTMRCRILVNQGQHTGIASVTASADSGGGVAELAPRPLNFLATHADDVFVCTSWHPAGGPTLYWEAGPFLGTGNWSTDPDVGCRLAVLVDPA